MTCYSLITHDTLGVHVQLSGPEAVEVAAVLLPVLGVHTLVSAVYRPTVESSPVLAESLSLATPMGKGLLILMLNFLLC